jgi:hypothetical protein
LSIKNIAYNFKKPYIGLLEAKTKDDTWDGLPTL